jgi:hypothetical protein
VGGGALLAVLLSLPGLAPAHDLWIVPGKYRLEPSESTRVFVNSGDVFPESLTLLGSHRVAELSVHGPGWPDGFTLVTEFRVDGRSLTFDLAPPAPGSHVLGLETRPRTVRLKPEDFEDYLSEEKLARMAELREQAGESEEAAVERYTKWAKTVIEVAGDVTAGGDAAPAWAQPIGHRIELVPLQDPNRLSSGDSFAFEVRFEGEPLGSARVVGGRAGGDEVLEVETDDGGKASVRLPKPGRWYVRTLHMIRSEEDPEVRWESFWCTFTFEVAESARESDR